MKIGLFRSDPGWTAPVRATAAPGPSDGYIPSTRDHFALQLAALKDLTRQGSPAVAWEAPLPCRLSTPPAVGPDGTAYALGADGVLRAFAAGDGTPLYELEQASSRPGDREFHLTAGPTRLYMSSGEGVVVALDSRSGEPLWTQEVVGPLEAPPAQDEQGNLYVAGRGGLLYSLDARDGERRWVARVSRSGYLAARPVLTGSGSLLLGTSEGWLRSLDPDTGVERWALRLNPDDSERALCVNPSASGQGLLVGTSAGLVQCLGEADGSTRWSYQGRPNQRFEAPLECPSGLVAAACQDEVLGLAQGQPRWRWSPPEGHELAGAPALDARGRLTVASEKAVFGLDPDTGRLLWSGSTSARLVPGLALDSTQDLVLAAGREGESSRLLALSPDPAERLSRRAAGRMEPAASRAEVRGATVVLGGVVLRRRPAPAPSEQAPRR